MAALLDQMEHHCTHTCLTFQPDIFDVVDKVVRMVQLLSLAGCKITILWNQINQKSGSVHVYVYELCPFFRGHLLCSLHFKTIPVSGGQQGRVIRKHSLILQYPQIRHWEINSRRLIGESSAEEEMQLSAVFRANLPVQYNKQQNQLLEKQNPTSRCCGQSHKPAIRSADQRH